MSAYDFFAIFIWWLAIQILAIGVLPLTTYLFKKMPDFGWGLGKFAGMVILAYLSWILATARIVPFQRFSIILVFLAFSIITWTFFIFKTSQLFPIINGLKKVKFLIMFEELLFAVALFGFSFLRGFQPQIFGLEKFSDFGMISSLLRSNYMPPADIWFAGKTINYYYFGHLIVASLTKFTSLSSPVTFNLSLATFFALTILETFSLVFALTKKYWASFLGFLFLAFSSNLHPVTHLTNLFKNYWYPDARNLDPYVINEFPIYTFVVSDLHPHLMAIPLSLLLIGVILTMILFEEKINWRLIVAGGFLLGLTYMTNNADFLIYSMLIGATFFFLSFKGGFSWKKFFKNIFWALTIGFLAIDFAVPFFLSFNPFVAGVRLVHSHSTLTFLLTMWGMWLFIGASFAIILGQKREKWVFGDQFFLFIFGFVAFLILIPEIIYFEDIYSGYYRANTIFKFYWQAWILVTIASSYALSRISQLSRARLLIPLFGFVGSLMIFTTVIYPHSAINSFFNGLRLYQGLDGSQFIAQNYPTDYQAIEWLNKNIAGQPTVLEAAGLSYTYANRISTFTGLPTVVGWHTHEWLWRPNHFDQVQSRTDEVAKIYQTPDRQETQELLKKYNVDYLVLGDFERQQYQNLDEDKFIELGTIVFENSRAKIFKINKI